MNRILPLIFLAICFSLSLNASAQDFVSKYHLRGVANYYYSDKSQIVGLDFEMSEIYPLQFFDFFNVNRQKWDRKLLFKSYGYSIGQLGFEYNVTQNNYGIRLGLFQSISRFSFNPIQFVYNFGQTYKGLTYRPEIGIGFWIFQLNYGINLNFKKELKQYGQHMIIFKIHLLY